MAEDTTGTTVLLEERENVLGLSFTLDADRLANVALHCGLTPEVMSKVEIHLVDKEKSINAVADVLKTEETEDGPKLVAEKHIIHLCVSDRPEFSEKSVIRVNRNLVHSLRMLSLAYGLTDVIGDRAIAVMLMKTSPNLWHSIAYGAEKIVKTEEHMRALLPVDN